jgi:hypothetical protein
MSTEMERALDEILSGVEDLLKKVPAQDAEPSVVVGEGSSVKGLVSDAAHPDPSQSSPSAVRVTQGGVSDGMTALLVALEGDPGSHLAESAHRLLEEILSSRMVGLPQAIDPDGLLTVSPCLVRPIENLLALGVVLDRYDAGYLYGDSSACQPEQIRQVLGRYAPLFCPEQNAYRHRFRMPRLPERVVLRWCHRSDINPIAGFEREDRVALIDQDNDGGGRSTMIWFSSHRFVPDHWCGLAFHDGRWRPVTHAST